MIRDFCLTFDVDLTDYLSGTDADEMDQIFDIVKGLLCKFPEVKTTWFIRIDEQINCLYGCADFIFKKHHEKLSWLAENGHALGWHFHAYLFNNGTWIQNANEEDVIQQLDKYSSSASQYNLKIVRMGWGYHTNKTFAKISELGYQYDSSAIPRPRYSWDKIIRDWSGTTNRPYFPAKHDYRISALPAYRTLEIPITTSIVSLPSDTELVKRYMNIAYKPEYFQNSMALIRDLDLVVAITHPYEIVANKENHPLISFSIRAFEDNLLYLLDNNYRFINMLSIDSNKF